MTTRTDYFPDCKAICTDLWEDNLEKDFVLMEEIDFEELIEKTEQVFNNSEVAIDVKPRGYTINTQFFETYGLRDSLSGLDLSDSDYEEANTALSGSEDTGVDPLPEITGSEIKEIDPLEKKTNKPNNNVPSEMEDFGFGLWDSETHKTETVPTEQKTEVPDIKKNYQVFDKEKCAPSKECQFITCLFIVAASIALEYYYWSNHSITWK